MDLQKQLLDYEEKYKRLLRDSIPQPGKVYLFLQTFLPVEHFLKELWQNGQQTELSWNYATAILENPRFEISKNIDITRHYRYDCSRQHLHTYFQLNYVVSGSPLIHHGNEQYTASPGDFFLLAPEIPHWIESNADDILVIKIYIRLTTFENTFFRLLGEKNVLASFFRHVLYNQKEKSSYICFHTGGDLYIREYVLETFRLHSCQTEYLDIILDCRLTELFCYLVGSYMETSHSSVEPDSSTGIGKILTYLHRNYAAATLEGTAAWAGYNKNYLCRLLKNTTGKTFTELLNAIRMEKARKFLSSSTLSVTEIAAAVGYGTLKHFYRIFRQTTGTTPQKYRQMHEAEEI